MGTRRRGAIDAHIAKKLREIRRAQNLPMHEVAGLLGITHQQWQKYEKGANVISAGRLWDMAEILRVPVWMFFDGFGADWMGHDHVIDVADSFAEMTAALRREFLHLNDALAPFGVRFNAAHSAVPATTEPDAP